MDGWDSDLDSNAIAYCIARVEHWGFRALVSCNAPVGHWDFPAAAHLEVVRTSAGKA